MENKEYSNESNLPEKGAQEADDNQNNAEKSPEVSASENDKQELADNMEAIENPTVQNDENAEPQQAEKSDDADGSSEPQQEESVPVEDEKTPMMETETESKNEEAEEKEAEQESEENEPEENTTLEETKPKEKKPFKKEDYSELDKTELLTKMNTLINNYAVEEIKDAVEDIKVNFYKKHKAEIAEAKRVFEEQGGNPEDFKPADDASEETFKELYNQFREKKNELTHQLDQQKHENLKKKYQIIDVIKELINKEESINKTFQEFRDLQQRWREIGLVPQKDVKNLWETYNHNVEKFYDYIKINKELRDLDLKKNMEAKIQLCEKAEALLLEDSITKAFKTLQEYHNQYREIGPVPRDKKDEIWERFKAATTKINKKHQEYFEGLKEQQVKNLEQKTVLCEKVEEILEGEYKRPKEWEEKGREVIEIQKLWRTIGFAPKKDNNKIYHRFKTACDEFFSRKREFYKETKELQKNNLQLKLDLCVQAEALKDSTEWKKSTEDFINLQKRWKEIGPVPKKHSESLWKRFRTACDHFFNQKSDFFSNVDSRQEDNLKLKEALIEKVKNFEKGENEKENLKRLIQIQKEWADIGHVPLSKKDEVQKEFREAINAQFDKLKIDLNERNVLNFKTKVDGWVSSNARNKLYSERNKLVNKIRELENEISLYENNIGFFSKSSNSEAMVEEIHKKIEKARERMEGLKEKLQVLDNGEQDLN